jgi:hypothetical protein
MERVGVRASREDCGQRKSKLRNDDSTTVCEVLSLPGACAEVGSRKRASTDRGARSLKQNVDLAFPVKKQRSSD